MSDKITPEQLRKEAVAVERMHGETLTVDWRTKQANQLRAHADALEENARLRAELGKFSDRNVYALRQRAEAELAKLRQLTAQQAEDDGLWFSAATAPEAYLQQELRKLHAAIEGTK